MQTLRIRHTDDLDLIAELDAEVFGSRCPIDASDLNDSRWWLATVDGEHAGYCGLKLDGFLSRAGVLKQYRGHGLQQRLIQARVRHARALGMPRVWSYVWAGNVASMRSLNKCGLLPYTWCRSPCTTGEPVTFIYLEKKLQKVLTQAA